MDWSGLGKELLSKGLPVLGTAVGGPLGTVAGLAGSAIATALGCEATPDSIQAAITADAIVKLKELEIKDNGDLKALQAKQLEADLANVKDARQKEVELAKLGHGAAWGTMIISVLITVSFGTMLWYVLDKDQPSQVAVMLLGTLATAFCSVVNYYVSSSQGSKDKDKLIQQAMFKTR